MPQWEDSWKGHWSREEQAEWCNRGGGSWNADSWCNKDWNTDHPVDEGPWEYLPQLPWDQAGANAVALQQPPPQQAAAKAGPVTAPVNPPPATLPPGLQAHPANAPAPPANPPPPPHPPPPPPRSGPNLNIFRIPIALEVRYSLAQIREHRGDQRSDLSNVALKWLRDTHEDPPGHPNVEEVDLTDQRIIQIGQIIRNKGPLYRFHATNTQPWSWLLMIKGFGPDVQTRIVGNGLVSIKLMPIPNTYDHKRAKAQADNRTPYEVDNVPIWDFVVLRRDGTQVRFHPNLKGGKVTIVGMEDVPLSIAHPKAGPGLSDGPGTFRAMVNRAYPGGQTVRAHPPMPKGAGKGNDEGNAAGASSSWQ